MLTLLLLGVGFGLGCGCGFAAGRLWRAARKGVADGR